MWVSLAVAIENGDMAFKQRKDELRANEALREYRQAYQADPSNISAAWRVGMACYFVGLRFRKDEDERKALYREGKEAALGAAKRDDTCAPCHFWGAINLALYGDAVGVFKMLFALDDIREHLHRTIELDPAYAYGGAYRLLGLIEQKLPGILGGSNDRAKGYFEKAISVAPDEPLNYLFLTKLLKNELHHPEEATPVLRTALALSPPAPERLESIEALAELRSLTEPK